MSEYDRIVRPEWKHVHEGKYVLYWMQRSQRFHYNHALLRASMWSLYLDMPLVVFFGIDEKYSGTNERHLSFMLEGLSDVYKDLEHVGIKMVVRNTRPQEGVLELAGDSSIIVCDKGYLKHERMWNQHLINNTDRQVEIVESDVVIPVETAYHKEAYSAAVLRPRIHRLLNENLTVPRELWPEKDSTEMDIDGLDMKDPSKVLKDLDIDRSVGPVEDLKGGGGEANVRLHRFLDKKLERYDEERNDPSRSMGSGLSPYLHYGMISPLFITLKALNEGKKGTDKFLEELIVRRELAVNFTYYNDSYDSFNSITGWALETLRSHENDMKEYLYSLEELENAETHDPYWNSAQKEMVGTGIMHNYMRMYWGKKILEWTRKPEEGYDIAIFLNNKYSLDGMDPNSYAGVAWCFGKHDRPWTERPIFGKVRYMNDRGLERKFEMEPYVRRFGG